MLLFFVLAVVVGVFLHLDRVATRRVIVGQINAALATSFRGKIVVERLDGLRVSGIDGLRARLTDPDGVEVVVIDDVRVRFSALDVVRSALIGGGDIGIDIGELSVAKVEVNADNAADGVLRILHAIESPGPPSPPSPSSGPLGIELTLPFVIDRIDVRRHLPALAGPEAETTEPPLVEVALEKIGGKFHLSSSGMSAELDNLDVSTHGAPMRLDGAGIVTGTFSLPQGGALQATASFEGEVGRIPIKLHGSMAGSHVDASIDAPGILAERVKEILPAIPLHEDVAVNAEVHGELPELDATLHLVAPSGKVDVDGHVALGDNIVARVVIDAKALHASMFAPTAPVTVVDAATTVSVTVKPSGELEGDFEVDLRGGSVAANLLPGLSLKGTFAKNPGSTIARGHGSVGEPGVDGVLDFEVRPDAASFTLTASVPRLDALPRAKTGAKGKADLVAKGTMRFADASIDATVDATLDQVSLGPQRVAHATVKAHAVGRTDALALDAEVAAKGIEASGLKFVRGTASVHGSIAKQDVALHLEGGSGWPDVDAKASIDQKSGLTVRDAKMVLARNNLNFVVRAATVRVAPGDIRAEGVVLDGLGQVAHATARITPGAIYVRADSPGLDLSRIARFARIEKVVGGQAAFDIDMTVEAGRANGHVLAAIQHFAFGELTDATIYVDAAFHGRGVAGSAQAAIPGIGQIDVKVSQLEIGPAGPLDPEGWRKAYGAVEVQSKLDLARAAALLPMLDKLPIANISGSATIQARVARDSSEDAVPALLIAAKTEHLGFDLKAPPIRSSDTDLQLNASIDGESGFCEVAARFVDKFGALVAIDAKSNDVPYGELLASPKDAASRMQLVPFAASVVLPKRPLQRLPPAIGALLDGASGEVEATLYSVGTVREPRMDLTVRADKVQVGGSPLGIPLNANLTARYNGVAADASLAAETSRGVEVMRGGAHVDLKLSDLMALAPGQELPWKSSVHAELFRFPLAAVSMLADAEVHGFASGTVAVRELHVNPRATAEVRLEDLRVGGAPLGTGRLTATVDDTTLTGQARIDQSDGFIDTSGTIGIVWGTAIAPTLIKDQRVSGQMKAHQFRAAGLRPFVQSTFSELDGRVDADLKVDSDTDFSTPKVTGTLVLSQGLFQLASVGEEFHEAKAKVVFGADGSVQVQDASAKGISGQVTLSAAAHLDGIKVKDATAQIKIPSGKALPLFADGTQVAQIEGQFDIAAKASPDGKDLVVKVEISPMTNNLPLTSAHDVQSLDVAANTHVGVYGKSDQFTKVRLVGRSKRAAPVASGPPPLTLKVPIHLGEDVMIKRGNELKVQLETCPIPKDDGAAIPSCALMVTVGDAMRVTGQINLKSGGYLEVQGKRFEIEKGVVSFVGDDPTNPEISVTAKWPAPDGTLVYADFIGPLRTGKVTLRAEPSRPKNEILALIVFGSATGSSATPYAQASGDASTTAGSAAGTFATAGLTQGLNKLTGLDINAKIDTTNAANPKPEVELQIARDISLQIAFVLGTPPPGTNPDKTFVSVGWRFVTNWSLQMTFGDQGSSIADVVWQYRY